MSVVDEIEIVGVVVKDYADVLTFQVFIVFLHLLVLVFCGTVSFLTKTPVAEKFFLFLRLGCPLEDVAIKVPQVVGRVVCLV